MKLHIYKLVDGAEVMATVLSDEHDEDCVMVEKVRQVVLQQNPQTGQVGVAFPPWLQITGDDQMEIERRFIMHTNMSPPKTLEDAYLQQTSGIALK